MPTREWYIVNLLVPMGISGICSTTVVLTLISPTNPVDERFESRQPSVAHTMREEIRQNEQADHAAEDLEG